MEDATLNLSELICNSLNMIFFKIFSSIDNTIYSLLDNILFINPDFVNNLKFQQIFGNSSTNGLLLIANSLIFGFLIFYILNFTLSHLIYLKVDSPYQFLFKSLIFVACINSSMWICEKCIYFTSIITDSILEIGHSINGTDMSFANLIDTITSNIYSPIENFDIFSLDGILSLCSTLGISYILIIYSVRFIMCKVTVLMSPFAFASLITNQTDGFFKGWLNQFLILLFMQIFVATVLVIGFSLDFYAGDTLSKLIYLAIIIVIAKCNYSVKNMFKFIYNYSHNTLKKFI